MSFVLLDPGLFRELGGGGGVGGGHPAWRSQVFSVNACSYAHCKDKEALFYMKYTGVASYTFRSNSREMPAYRGMTMACCCIIKEGQRNFRRWLLIHENHDY